MRSPAQRYETDEPSILILGGNFAELFAALYLRNGMTISDFSPQLRHSDGLVYGGDFGAAYGSLTQT